MSSITADGSAFAESSRARPAPGSSRLSSGERKNSARCGWVGSSIGLARRAMGRPRHALGRRPVDAPPDGPGEPRKPRSGRSRPASSRRNGAILGRRELLLLRVRGPPRTRLADRPRQRAPRGHARGVHDGRPVARRPIRCGDRPEGKLLLLPSPEDRRRKSRSRERRHPLSEGRFRVPVVWDNTWPARIARLMGTGESGSLKEPPRDPVGLRTAP